ncbi:MAG: hypothetical protein MK207_07460 [Saprospiraceae bacterium]|nr:hypothetical protein [Saprospiraceae bacterium]
MSSKIEKIKANVVLLKKELEKIKKLYSQDGTIDAIEQQQIDSMMATISQCEQRLSMVKNSGNNLNSDNDDAKDKDIQSKNNDQIKFAVEVQSKIRDFKLKFKNLFNK